MKKQLFVNEYKDRLLVHFDYTVFLNDPTIVLTKKRVHLRDFLDYFTPWHQKDGKVAEDINNVLSDPEFTILKISDAQVAEHKWTDYHQPKELWPIPIARDTGLNVTLVLDSNRTICSRIYQHNYSLDEEIEVYEVSGTNLRELNTDLSLIGQRFAGLNKTV